ncbi:MAG TPA: hypothetical protein DGT21_22255 [Armatimonadetes bacterium]|nr:hypothetical protein [Armatimonadota bacterium]
MPFGKPERSIFVTELMSAVTPLLSIPTVAPVFIVSGSPARRPSGSAPVGAPKRLAVLMIA